MSLYRVRRNFNLIPILLMIMMILIPMVNSELEVGPENDYKISAASWYSGMDLNHTPIQIAGNDDFKETANKENWTGNGTATNPFIIQNITFNGFGGAYCLIIRSVSFHFIIRNCTFINATANAGSNTAGLTLSIVKNARIMNCTIMENHMGVYIGGDNIAFQDSAIINNTYGMRIQNGVYNEVYGIKIQNNFISNNTYGGVTCNAINVKIGNNLLYNNHISLGFYSSNFEADQGNNNSIFENEIYYGGIYTSGRNDLIRNNTIIGGLGGTRNIGISVSIQKRDNYDYELNSTLDNNTLVNCHITLDETPFHADIFNLNITTGNLVNGKNVYYYHEVDLNGSILSEDAGEYIIVRSFNYTIANINTESGGILAIESHDIEISNCTFIDHSFGIEIRRGINFSVHNNSFNFIYNETENANYYLLPLTTIAMTGEAISISGKDIFLSNNSMVNCFIYVETLNEQQYITPSNTVNGKEVMYQYDVDLNETNLNCKYGQIILSKVRDIHFRNLTMKDIPYGVVIYQCDSISISNSSFVNISKTALTLREIGGGSVLIENSTFNNCLVGIGAYLANGMNIIENDFIECDGMGIYGEFSYVNIEKNIFYKNSEGIQTKHRSGDGSITGNLIIKNIFHQNIGYAARIMGNGNRLYNNTFIENNQQWMEHGNYDDQVYIFYNENLLYDPIGNTGNYWSDHTGNDTNDDGIIDDPYVLDQWREDPYPLNYSPSLPILNISGTGLASNVNLFWDKNVQVPWIFSRMFVEFICIKNGIIDHVKSVDFRGRSYLDSKTNSDVNYTFYARFIGYPLDDWHRISGGKSNYINISTDGTDPTVKILNPSRGFVTPFSNILFAWEGYDAGSGLSHYEVMIDGYAWKNVDLNTTYEAYLPDEGFHEFSICAYDNVGNRKYERAYFMIDRSNPYIYIKSPSRSIYNTSEIEIRWSIDDEKKKVVLSQVFIDGVFYKETTTEREILSPSFSEGYHTIMVKVFDEYGYTGTDWKNITIDMTPPIFKVISPSNGSFTNASDVKVTWNVYDDISSVSQIKVNVDNGPWIDLRNVDAYLLTNLSEGVHTLLFKIEDEARNLVHGISSFVVDLSNPFIKIISHKDGTLLTNDSLIIEWESQDLIGEINHKISIDNRAWVETDGIDSHILSNLSDGHHKISILVFDMVYNTAFDSVNISIDTIPPKVVDHYPIGNNVEIDSDIWVIFSEPIDFNSLYMYVSSFPVKVSRGNDTFFHQRYEDLRYDLEYEVMVTCSDIHGNELDPISWTFITVDRSWIRINTQGRDEKPLGGVGVYIDNEFLGITDDDGYFLIQTTSGNHSLMLRMDDESHDRAIGSLSPGETFKLPTITFESKPYVDDGEENDLTLGLILMAASFSILLMASIYIFIRIKNFHEDDSQFEE